jgi:ring-1,2-phenylacetyl-CoA epoxidase subunit PaaC
MVRSLLFDAYQVELWAAMAESDDPDLAGIAGRALKEARYHLRHSSAWVIRLGDGTTESHDRAQRAVDSLWRYTGEMFEAENAPLQDGWRRRVSDVLGEATLRLPEDRFQRSGGRQGMHTEHLGHLLAEMQSMQRSYPGLRW